MGKKDVSDREQRALDRIKGTVGEAAYNRREVIAQVSEMVKRWRLTADLTQGQLADRIGKRQNAISRIESVDNRSMPSVDTLAAIAHACHRDFVLGSAPRRGLEGNVGTGKPRRDDAFELLTV